MNFRDIFDVSMYTVELDGIREEGELLIEEFDITIENKKISETEYVYIEFEGTQDNINIKEITTWSNFGEKHKKKPCEFCGCLDMELEEDDEEEGTQTYTHKCNFNEDEVKEYLQEVMSSEYIKNYFDEEEFEKHYTIVGRDKKEGIYQFIDEWSNCYYLIKNNTVYHLSPFKEEIYCFHCENNEEVKFDEESLGYYQICLTLTRHVDKFINMIRNRTTLAASVSHEERYADDIELAKEEKEENNETPQERLQRVINEIPTNNEREHQLIKDLKHKLKDRIEKPIQEHVFRIKEDNNKVSLSLEGIMLSMSEGGYDINFYDELFVIKLNENGQTIQYLNEIMLKDIESWGFWFGEKNEKLTEAIKEAEDTFNNFVMKKP